MDAHPELHAAVGRQFGVAGLGHALDLHRTAHDLDRAAELGQEVVAGELHPPPVLADVQIDQLAVCLHGADGRVLIVRHRPAVPDHVGRDDRGETPLGSSHRGATRARLVLGPMDRLGRRVRRDGELAPRDLLEGLDQGLGCGVAALGIAFRHRRQQRAQAVIGQPPRDLDISAARE